MIASRVLAEKGGLARRDTAVGALPSPVCLFAGTRCWTAIIRAPFLDEHSVRRDGLLKADSVVADVAASGERKSSKDIESGTKISEMRLLLAFLRRAEGVTTSPDGTDDVADGHEVDSAR